jgi:hypothetical protein
MAPWVTEKFLAILSNLEESYKKSKRSQRKEVVKQGVLEITASAGKDGVAIPPNLDKVCSQLHSHLSFMPIVPLKKVLVWFQNCQQRKKDQPTKKKSNDARSAMTWTVRKVVKEQMSDEVDALVLEKDPRATRGSKNYLTLVQDCLTEVIEGLSKEKVKEFADLADLRNTVGVDPDLKAKSVEPSPVYLIEMLK